ncbi:MAG TPA: hypothetical protein VGR57_15105 [Ktedonobacterales bacterium]|nr:hypothetical protein [Ktedonobacterales bacterium]
MPALYLLARERRDHLVRLHAAQSLVFHGLVGLAQMVLFVAVVLLGGAIQSTTGALVAATAIFVLFAGLLLVVAITWAHLVADCIRGRVGLLPLVGHWAEWLEALATRASAPRQRAAAPTPLPCGDVSDTPPPAS